MRWFIYTEQSLHTSHRPKTFNKSTRSRETIGGGVKGAGLNKLRGRGPKRCVTFRVRECIDYPTGWYAEIKVVLEESAANSPWWSVGERKKKKKMNILWLQMWHKGTWLVFIQSEGGLQQREVFTDIHRLAQLLSTRVSLVMKLSEACWCQKPVWYKCHTSQQSPMLHHFK